MNGGTTAFRLEQRFRLPSLFDPPQIVENAKMGMNSSNDPEVTVRSEEGCARGRMGFSEGSASNDTQRVLGGKNGAVYSVGLNEHGMFEDLNRIGLGNSGTMLRNDVGSNRTTVVERVPHTGSTLEPTIHPLNGKKPSFPNLNGPTHLDQSGLMIPSTSSCDLGTKPLVSRLVFGDRSPRLLGSGHSHDLPPQTSSFSDRPAPLMSFGDAASPNQISHSVGGQICDTPDKSATSPYTVVQTNVLNKIEPGGKYCMNVILIYLNGVRLYAVLLK